MARRQLHHRDHREGRQRPGGGDSDRDQAPVDSADLTQNPPLLSIAGQDYTLDKIKRVVRKSN